MADYYDSTEGASAANYTAADYSGNHFSLLVDGQFEAYYITRFADAIDYSDASLTGNSITVFGSVDPDQVFVNAQVNATENSWATSSWNSWFVDLGEGDDAGVIHSLAAGIGTWTEVSVSYDTVTLFGGAGSDILQTTQYVSALDGALVSIEQTSRFIDGGEGYDSINAGVTIEGGLTEFAGGTAIYSGNGLYVNAGADGANILAQTFVTASWDGNVELAGNSYTLLGGSGTSFIQANVSINSGSADAAGGAVGYSNNSLFVESGSGGGNVYAQNQIFTYQYGYVSFSDNNFILLGRDGADVLSSGVGFTSGSAEYEIAGGDGDASNNSFYADGGAGDDFLDFFLTGWAEYGGSISITGNSFYGAGGDGDDTLNFNLFLHVDDSGVVEISGNSGSLDGGAGSDSLNAYLGEGTSGNSIILFGGDGDDYITSVDFGQNNQQLLSGGAGDDTIVDGNGFSTVMFEGARADYSFTALGSGWISVTDNRDGSPDGTDQLYQVDQLRFSDGDILVADLSLPIEGTENDDVLFGSDGDDFIYGFGGNDTLWGYAGNDTLDGGSGNDVLIGLDGNDTLLGGDGNDQLIGNRGADQLTGGAGADTFTFGALFQSTPDAPDLITDFSGALVLSTNSQGRVIRTPGEGDKIDLSFLDANVYVAGDQAFTLVKHGFSGSAGEAYSSFNSETGLTSLFLDVDGDAMADMEVQLLGQVNLIGADFIL